jgi:hypothetical protein
VLSYFPQLPPSASFIGPCCPTHARARIAPIRPHSQHTGQLRPIHPPALPCKSFYILRSSLARPPFGRAGVLFAGGRSLCSALFQCVFIVSARSVYRSPSPLGSGAPTLAPQIPFRHWHCALKNSRQVKREFCGGRKLP